MMTENSTTGTTTRLGYLVDAIQYPDQMSLEAATFAANYELSVLAVAAVNNEGLTSAARDLAGTRHYEHHDTRQCPVYCDHRCLLTSVGVGYCWFFFCFLRQLFCFVACMSLLRCVCVCSLLFFAVLMCVYVCVRWQYQCELCHG